MTTQADEIEMYFDNSNGACNNYIESLARTRKLLSECPSLISKLDELLSAELDLAIMETAKAKSNMMKTDKTSSVRPIK